MDTSTSRTPTLNVVPLSATGQFPRSSLEQLRRDANRSGRRPPSGRGLLLATAALLSGCFNPGPLPELGGTDTDRADQSSGAAASAVEGSGGTDEGIEDTSGEDTSAGGRASCSAPPELSVFSTEDQTLAIALDRSFAYVTESSGVVRILDISDPAHIVQVGDVALPNPWEVTASVGGVALVADSSGVVPVDVRFPTDPIAGSALDLGARVWALEVVGETAYALTSDGNAPCESCGFYVIDAGTPSTMSVVDSLPMPRPGVSMAIEGQVAFVADYDLGLVSIDLSGPTFLGAEAINVADVAVADGIAYVAAVDGGLVIFDAHNPSDIVELGSIDGEFALGVAVEGDRVWLADADYGLRVIDVSDPTDPMELAAVDTFGSAVDVAVADGIAYVTSLDGDLRVFGPPVCD